MSTLRFEWDERKAAANAKKHVVSFDEARSVFFDDRARLIDDLDHSEDEERFILLGLSSSLRLLLVCHCLPLLPEREQRHTHHLRTQGNCQ